MTTELVELADRLEALAGALGNIDPDGGSAGYRLLGDAYGEAEEIAAAIRALASRAGGPTCRDGMVIKLLVAGGYVSQSKVDEATKIADEVWPAAPEPVAVG